jgi:lysophospholipase L1-like esterase
MPLTSCRTISQNRLLLPYKMKRVIRYKFGIQGFSILIVLLILITAGAQCVIAQAADNRTATPAAQLTQVVCPVGTRPAPAGTVGAVSAVGGGISQGSTGSILDIAHRYAGRSYGTGPGAFVGTTFLIQVLRDAGATISSDTEKAINIISSKGTGASLVDANDPVHKGVQYALVQAGIGEEVALDVAQAGDLVQYWLKTAGSWEGRAGIVENANEDGSFDIFGAMPDEKIVAVVRNVNLKDASVKAYVVRFKQLQAKPSATEGGSSLSSTQGCGTKVAAVGDSITTGASYVKYLRELCGSGTEIKNSDGSPGPKTDKFSYGGKGIVIMANDFQAVLDWNPDTIILLGGTNNLAGKPSVISEAISKMVLVAHEKNIRFVSLTVPPFKSRETRPTWVANTIARNNLRSLDDPLNVVKAANEWILSSSNPADIKVNIYAALEDPNEPDAANPSLYSKDLVHPNEAGKKVMAQKVYDALTSAPSTASAGPASKASGSSQAANMVCIPDTILPKILYDFIINSSSGITTIIGIARQNIAVGINKTAMALPAGAACVPLAADKDYDPEFLKKTYGRNELEVRAQIQQVSFMGKDVEIHRLVAPALACVEQEIKNCEEGRNYNYRTIDSFIWQGLADQPDVLATSSFGISLNINLDTNPNAQNNQLMTDIPQCVVAAFKRFGFKWGGDFQAVKSPAHFEFMAEPARISIQEKGAAGIANATGRVAMGQGDTVAIYSSESKEWATFKGVAEKYVAKYGGTVYPAKDAQDILDAIRKHQSISRLIIAGHGMAYGVLRPGAAGLRTGSDSLPKFVSVETFAAELGSRLVSGAVIALAACNAGKNPGDPGNWDVPSYAAGGERSLAGKLRDALASQPNIAEGVNIRAHTTAGHTTRNPAVRRFPVGKSEIGQPGHSVLAETLGEEGLKSNRKWATYFGGATPPGKPLRYSYAADWIAGESVSFEMDGVTVNVV